MLVRLAHTRVKENTHTSMYYNVYINGYRNADQVYVNPNQVTNISISTYTSLIPSEFNDLNMDIISIKMIIRTVTNEITVDFRGIKSVVENEIQNIVDKLSV